MFVIPMLIMFVIPMPIQVSSFLILTPPPAKSQTSPCICYGFLTNPPAGTKPPALGKRTANPKELSAQSKGTKPPV